MKYEWKRDNDPDAEYNQHFAVTTGGVKLLIFSDRDSEDWGYQVGDDDSVFGHDSKQEAMEAAEEAEDADHARKREVSLHLQRRQVSVRRFK